MLSKVNYRVLSKDVVPHLRVLFQTIMLKNSNLTDKNLSEFSNSSMRDVLCLVLESLYLKEKSIKMAKLMSKNKES